MSEIETKSETAHDDARREFLKKAGTVAVALPAVALLLKASDAKAWGFNPYGHDRPKKDRHRGRDRKPKYRKPSWLRRRR